VSSKRSIAGVLVDLESQVAKLEKEESFHAEQEAAHRKKREACTKKLALVRERYEAFRSASAAVGEVVTESAPALEEPEGRTSVIRLVARLVAAKGPDERFTPSELAGELIQQFPESFRRPVGSRTISATLRRLAEQGGVRVVEEGKPYHEAVYGRSVRQGKKG
jgi:hypothetical protein